MPRLQMFAVAAGSGLAGFLTSFTLLHLNVQSMWLRYGFSVVVAYAVFLTLVRAWTEYYRRNPGEIARLRALGGQPEEGRLPDVVDLFDFLEADGVEEIILVLLLGIAVYLLIFTAPEWIAELVLDGVLSATLYRRLREIDQRNWLDSAVKKTAGPFLCVLALFVGVAALCAMYAPEAHSIGGVIRHATYRR